MFIILTITRGFLTEVSFDRWAPALAVLVGVVLAEAYALVSTNPITGEAALQAFLVGLFAGAMSQNINHLAKTAKG